jgi:hypothetical protein
MPIARAIGLGPAPGDNRVFEEDGRTIAFVTGKR